MPNAKISDLALDTRNANQGTSAGRKLVARSLKDYGAGRSILVDKHGNIIAGNKTVEGAKSIGLDDLVIVPSDGSKLVAVQRTDLEINSRKARELAIADNRSSEIGLEWDGEVLASLEGELDLSQFWSENELDKMLAEFRPQQEIPEPQIDRAAELQQKWATARGQIWEIGKHRLMCGDATSADDHAALLGKVQIDAVLTDPPYGVGIEYGEFIDTKENVCRLIDEFMPLVLKWPVVAVSSGHACLWHYPEPAWLLGWVLPNGGGQNPWGFTCYHPVPVWGKDPYLANGLGGRPDCLVESNASREGAEAHPVIKPVAWWQWLLLRITTKRGQSVLDPFTGSGATLAVAAVTDRVAYGLELEPKYVAVALERMADMNLKPRLTNG